VALVDDDRVPHPLVELLGTALTTTRVVGAVLLVECRVADVAVTQPDRPVRRQATVTTQRLVVRDQHVLDCLDLLDPLVGWAAEDLDVKLRPPLLELTDPRELERVGADDECWEGVLAPVLVGLERTDRLYGLPRAHRVTEQCAPRSSKEPHPGALERVEVLVPRGVHEEPSLEGRVDPVPLLGGRPLHKVGPNAETLLEDASEHLTR
jgi:hypothetical protein